MKFIVKFVKIWILLLILLYILGVLISVDFDPRNWFLGARAIGVILVTILAGIITED